MFRPAGGSVLVFGTCFSTGFAILALELTALRLLAPYFGASNYVAGIVINSILLALAAGYLLGGHAADAHKSDKAPYVVICVSAICLTVMQVFYSPLLRALAGRSLPLGVALAMVLIFFLPITLLAFIPPYFVKMLSQGDSVGKTAGRIYALSTLGSIAGGLSTTFLLLPAHGSRITFQATVILLYVNAAAGLACSGGRAFATLLLMLIPLVFLPPAGRSSSYLHREESAYNVITITESQGRRYLRLNDGFGHHSQTLDPVSMMSDEYYDFFLVAQMLSHARHTLILGNGAGTSMMQTAHFFPTNIDGVEIDPRLSALGRSYFGLQLTDAMRIYHEDARSFLIRKSNRYDVIYVDVYAGNPYVPFHVSTVEFYDGVRRALVPGGIAAVNLPFYAAGTELEDRLLSTISAVFPSTYLSGGMAYAFAAEVSKEQLEARLTDRAFPPALELLVKRTLAHLRWVTRGSAGEIFTDDHAPVEKMTFELLEQRPDRGRQIIE